MRVREARHSDAAAVSELLEELGYRQDGRRATARRMEEWAEDPLSGVFVAELEAEILGVIAVHVCPFFERDGCWARIVALVVSGRVRHRGVGTRLVTAAERFGAGRGCVRLEVTSADDRHGAHQFYRRRGYIDQAGKSSRFLRELPADAPPGSPG